MSRAVTGPHMRAVILLLLFLGVLSGVNWLWLSRIDPAAIPQAELHRIATTGDGFVMSPRPRVHRVVMRSLSPRDLGRVRDYLPAPVGTGNGAIEGQYDPATQDILIVGLLPRLQAGLRVPWLQGSFRHALRHEYGHAYLYEWLAEKGGTRGARFAEVLGRNGRPHPSAAPARLKPVVAEFLSVRSSVYGSSYYTSSFDEYFAESYGRFVAGKSVPYRTRAFLREGARPQAAGTDANGR